MTAIATRCCTTPGCDAERVGRWFCSTCSDRLAKVRDAYEHEGTMMSANGGATRRTISQRGHVRRGRGRPIPTCCNPNCWNPRLNGRRFCDTCEADGWSEEDYYT